MDAAAIAGLCVLLARGAPETTVPPGVPCPPSASHAASLGVSHLREEVGSAEARDAIARVAFAEAGNQGDSGLAAVVYTILNRLVDGRWGGSVNAVLNARAQFEPVLRAGGDWRNLAQRSAADQARIDTILNLALDGRLPDLTRGARFFQNPTLVAARARAGVGSADLMDFGGATPSVQIGAHRFYVDMARGRGGGHADLRDPHTVGGAQREMVLFVGGPPNSPARTLESSSAASTGDPSQAMFVGSNGLVTAPRP